MKARTLTLALVTSFLLPLVPACDNSEEEAKKAAEAKAAADKKKAEEEKLAARKKAREDKKKAEKEAEEKKKAEIDALCVLPEKLPKKLDKACEEAGVAYDKFMERVYGDNKEVMEKWQQGKKMQMQMMQGTCMKTGSIEAAACQTNALNTAPPEMKKAVSDFAIRCGEKFPKKEG